MADTEYMKMAIQLSKEHMESGEGGPFGAVIVKDNKIIGRGWNQVTSANDPTAHAEVAAIRNACQNLKDFSLKGASIYTSCEPCPMCLAAIYWARIDKIYFANTRKDAADIGFDDHFLYEEIALPIEKRQIPMIQTCHDSALKVFKSWQNKADKTHY